jgi:hypothetical protein
MGMLGWGNFGGEAERFIRKFPRQANSELRRGI